MGEKSLRTPPSDRGVEQAIVSLKKGAQLLKYGRRGKPKFCPFRLSTDEKVLIWYSGKEEKQLKLSLITKIIPGQRTVNFQRQPQLEKESQSFSLVYGNGERSLDLICKDKDQAESWFVGLTALVSRAHQTRHLANLRNGRGAHTCANSPVGHTRGKHNLGFLEDSAKFSQVRSLCGSPPGSLTGTCVSDGSSYSSGSFYSAERRTLSSIQTVTDAILPHFQHLEPDYCKEKIAESYPKYKMNLPRTISSFNHGSPSMDKDNVLRDVLMWGEGIEGGILGGGIDRLSTPFDMRSDALLPKLLESSGMLDVRNMSCGGKHAALVTRQGEVFCWGEEKGGRLGHKINMDVSCPKIVESLTGVHVESIACGEYHTCALTLSGELYTWGESGHGVGLLEDGIYGGSWLPHRVSGLLDGICISSVVCGEWHTAVVSSSGQLFTYGDGTFGVLGHGDCQSTSQPKEVESLKGLRVKSAACGPWHTAAIVEIMVDRFKGSAAGGKLFTWGDGDKGRLGHKDKERKVLPTCVASLVEHDFVQISCGRMLTVALTATGIVYTMGSAVHGQLGNPKAEDKSIATVEGNLKGEFVKEISSGSYHIAVLTSKGNVYTWGMGANGRLGLGDIEDRSSPALVEALKDRQILTVACGSSFTAAISLHKSISSSDQSICSGCKMIFGFTRKKHNCYNCGFVFCHACSSKKALNASLAPNKSKQCRVCDPCFTQLSKAIDFRLRQETSSPRPLLVMQKPSSDQRVDREEAATTRLQMFSPKLSTHKEIKCIEGKTLSKQGRNPQSLDPLSPSSNIPPRWGQVSCPVLFSNSNKGCSEMFVPLQENECIQQSPPRLKSMIPNGTKLERVSTESDKFLTEEVERLRAEAKNLAKQCLMKTEKLQQYQQRIEDTWSQAREEAAKSKAAKEVIKVLTTQLNAMSEKFTEGRESNMGSAPVDTVDVHLPQITPVCAESLEFDDVRSMLGSVQLSPIVRGLKQRQVNNLCSPPLPSGDMLRINEDHHHGRTKSVDDSHLAKIDERKSVTNGTKAEWVEQDEPGVYITFTTLTNGQKGVKRVRFSRRRFSEKEAERWWEMNQLRVCQKYDIEGIINSSKNKIDGRCLPPQL
ncbi:regulator of chromosome condensation (RCC1) family with FYVE zinc finger domain-containing protein [Tasmannia lanceolata]|uniref:regulator of chromosome condensation (RCC1) family with FYVE zinc finger domain-containing protein n=1 Tax=Tasmannia lanceolata TaxID=3420 RepID=UPI004063F7AB